MRVPLLFFLLVWVASSLWADDLTLAVQQRLKDQGFYYGAVDGQGGDETSAAIRRYQIRHGLKVTGQLNDDTLRSLEVSRQSAVGPASRYQKDGGFSSDGTDDQYDRRTSRPYDGRVLPQREGSDDFNEMEASPLAAPRVLTSFSQLFAGTIYERSPAQIQENVLYAVQGELMRGGFFKGVIDGRPGQPTTSAIVRLQEYAGLPVSGRLDNPTLEALQAFPGQRNGPPEENIR